MRVPLDFVRTVPKKRLLTIAAAAICCVGLTGYLAMQPKSQVKVNAQARGPASSQATKTAAPAYVPQIYVDVAGAVVAPGVYLLPADSRLEQAILAAGGFDISKVDKDYVARELNLSSKLTDGQKVYVYHLREREHIATITGLPMSSTTETDETGPLNLNSASQSQLEALPGIGPVTATKIIDNRPYQSVEDLLAKKAVSASLFGKLEGLVTAP